MTGATDSGSPSTPYVQGVRESRTYETRPPAPVGLVFVSRDPNASEGAAATRVTVECQYDADGKPPPKRAAADVFAVLPSSPELLTLYATTLRSDIVFGWYAEDVTLYAVSSLLQRQEGYRWAVGKHEKLLPGWNADWVVIGDVMGGDPIIAAPKERGTPLYWAMHGAGKWKPVLAAASLAQGAEALAAWLDVFRGEYKGNISDKDFVPRPDAVKAIKSKVAKIVGAGAVSPWLPS